MQSEEERGKLLCLLLQAGQSVAAAGQAHASLGPAAKRAKSKQSMAESEQGGMGSSLPSGTSRAEGQAGIWGGGGGGCRWSPPHVGEASSSYWLKLSAPVLSLCRVGVPKLVVFTPKGKFLLLGGVQGAVAGTKRAGTGNSSPALAAVAGWEVMDMLILAGIPSSAA